MYQAVRHIADFRTLDEGEIMIGYMDGISGLPLQEAASRSYWHGWRNGLVDGGFIEQDEAQMALDEEFGAMAGNA